MLFHASEIINVQFFLSLLQPKSFVALAAVYLLVHCDLVSLTSDDTADVLDQTTHPVHIADKLKPVIIFNILDSELFCLSSLTAHSGE